MVSSNKRKRPSSPEPNNSNNTQEVSQAKLSIHTSLLAIFQIHSFDSEKRRRRGTAKQHDHRSQVAAAQQPACPNNTDTNVVKSQREHSGKMQVIQPRAAKPSHSGTSANRISCVSQGNFETGFTNYHLQATKSISTTKPAFSTRTNGLAGPPTTSRTGTRSPSHSYSRSTCRLCAARYTSKSRPITCLAITRLDCRLTIAPS